MCGICGEVDLAGAPDADGSRRGARRRKLVLARDRLGKKPIYYWLRGSRIAFASELKALLAHGAVPRELDPEALVQYLACEYVPAPGTILRAVRKLPAAHVAVLDRSEEHTSELQSPCNLASRLIIATTTLRTHT